MTKKNGTSEMYVTYNHNAKGIYAHEWQLRIGFRSVALNVSEYDPDIGEEGGVNLSATGTLTPEQARTVARMLETAADVYEGRKNQVVSEKESGK